MDLLKKAKEVLTLEAFKGYRSKITIAIDIVLYALVKFGIITQDQFNQWQPIILSILGYFLIDHFEPKVTQ